MATADSDIPGCVAAGHPVTAKAAADVLCAGGNAFDAVCAAIATACVAEPVLASPGGGGFLLARSADAAPVIYDFFVHTPKHRRPREETQAHPVVTDWGTAQQEFQIGLGTVATPGLVRGLWTIHSDLGRLPIADVLAPAIAAARDGVEITPFQAYLMTLVAPIYLGDPTTRAVFGNPEGGLRRCGEQLHNVELGQLFAALAHAGDRLFYEGEVAAAIVAQCREHGGHLEFADLRDYRVAVRQPLTLRYRDATLFTNPPPAAGGLLIAFGLALLARQDLGDLCHASPVHQRLLAQVLAATADARTRHGPSEALLGDAIVDGYSETLAADLRHAYASYRGTTHISVIDRNGNAASVTLSNGEGCGTLVPGTGMMLNNMLGEDDVNPAGPHGWPPDTRLSSMMTPTAILRGDGTCIVTGSGGSKRIRSAILQVISNLVDFGMPLAAAVAAPRLHIDDGALLNREGGLPHAADALSSVFPRIIDWADRNMFFGGCHSVAQSPDGLLYGVGDPRRDGVCLGHTDPGPRD